MKNVSIHLCLVGFLISNFYLLTAFSLSDSTIDATEKPMVYEPEPDLQQAAFQVLKTKCKVCHKKKNPFKIFSLKTWIGMHRRFTSKSSSMAECQKVKKLTKEEYQTLKT